MVIAAPKVALTDPNYANALLTLGVTGSCHYAPSGSNFPENMGAFERPFVDLGWIADSGITESLNQEKNDFTPWQAQGSQRSQVSTQEFTFQVTIWSIGGLANSLYYGVAADDMKFDTESGVVSFTQGEELPEDFEFCLAITVIDGKKARRFMLPAASVSERGEITYSKSDLVGYQFTFKANLSNEVGYAIKREFLEGWKPGEAGTSFAVDKSGRNPGDWSTPATGAAADNSDNTAEGTHSVTLPSGVSGGTFTLAIDGAATAALNYNAEPAAIQSALRAVEGGSGALVSGEAGGPYTITGVSGTVTADGAELTGGASTTVTVS